MALEAVVFPQGLFGYTSKEFYSMGGGEKWSYEHGGGVEEEKKGMELECEMCGSGCGSLGSMLQNIEEWNVNSSSSEAGEEAFPATGEEDAVIASAAPAARRKRWRAKSYKNKEEVESQRMTHIAVERNRRKQMNEYLAMLRSLMPASYVQRGDQASIVGGAINFVKELEQLLHTLEANKRVKQQSNTIDHSSPFAGFFAFPQYSLRSSDAGNNNNAAINFNHYHHSSMAEVVGENQISTADIEVSMVESHASLKVLSRRQPKQLLKMVVGLQNLRLTTLHLNATTIDQMVLYSFSLKVEEDCQLTSVDEIALAVHQMLERIQEECLTETM